MAAKSSARSAPASASADAVQVALHAVLVDTYALAVKTHAAHWNVSGRGFFELHEAFSVQYTALFAAADEIAERLRALGATAPTGLQAITAATTVSDTTTHAGLELVIGLRADHQAVSKLCAVGVAAAQKVSDEATADLLIGRMSEHEKTAWMLGAWAG